MAVSCDPRHRESLFDALSLATSITSSMVEGHMVNLCAIVSRLINKCTYKVTTICRRILAWPYAFVGEFFLCSRGLSFVDARAISVASQIKDSDNLISLILVETLLGLDAVFHNGESQNFLGSPLTL